MKIFTLLAFSTCVARSHAGRLQAVFAVTGNASASAPEVHAVTSTASTDVISNVTRTVTDVQNGVNTTSVITSTTSSNNITTVHNVTTITPETGSTVSNATSPGVFNNSTGSGGKWIGHKCFPHRLQSHTLPVPKNATATASYLSAWWCPQVSEHAFMGFSYDITACPSQSQLLADFTRMRNSFGSRYVRIYSTCDTTRYYDKIVDAAATAGIGVYALVWFGFDGGDQWKARMAELIDVVKTNPRAPFVIRSIAVGSEPLFDWVLTPDQLAAQIVHVRNSLKRYKMQVTLSDMAYGYQIHDNAPQVFAAMDTISVNALPFFDATATTGGQAWPSLSWTISYFQQRGLGKIIRLTQTGWPSDTSIWKANNDYAEASVSSEAAYAALLDSKCAFFRANSIGYFWQIWSDADLSGWGFIGYDNEPKWTWKPVTAC